MPLPRLAVQRAGQGCARPRAPGAHFFCIPSLLRRLHAACLALPWPLDAMSQQGEMGLFAWATHLLRAAAVLRSRWRSRMPTSPRMSSSSTPGARLFCASPVVSVPQGCSPDACKDGLRVIRHKLRPLSESWWHAPAGLRRTSAQASSPGGHRHLYPSMDMQVVWTAIVDASIWFCCWEGNKCEEHGHSWPGNREAHTAAGERYM